MQINRRENHEVWDSKTVTISYRANSLEEVDRRVVGEAFREVIVTVYFQRVSNPYLTLLEEGGCRIWDRGRERIGYSTIGSRGLGERGGR